MRSVEEILLEQHERRMAAVRSLAPEVRPQRQPDGRIPRTITREQCAQVRALRSEGLTYDQIGARVKLSKSSVCLIVRGQR